MAGGGGFTLWRYGPGTLYVELLQCDTCCVFSQAEGSKGTAAAGGREVDDVKVRPRNVLLCVLVEGITTVNRKLSVERRGSPASEFR